MVHHGDSNNILNACNGKMPTSKRLIISSSDRQRAVTIEFKNMQVVVAGIIAFPVLRGGVAQSAASVARLVIMGAASMNLKRTKEIANLLR